MNEKNNSSTRYALACKFTIHSTFHSERVVQCSLCFLHEQFLKQFDTLQLHFTKVSKHPLITSGNVVQLKESLPLSSFFHPQIVASAIEGLRATEFRHIDACSTHLLILRFKASLVGGSLSRLKPLAKKVTA